jgi:hypothetical protein
MPIKELASVQVPDSQSITITPWDKSITTSIEKAIRASGKGLNPVNDGDGLRVPVPPLIFFSDRPSRADLSVFGALALMHREFYPGARALLARRKRLLAHVERLADATGGMGPV